MVNSLRCIREQEVKGKKSSLPRLTVALGDPYRKKWPHLEDNQLEKLEKILREALVGNESEFLKFILNKKIRLGLESSLRAINQKDISCVFISLSLRPYHVINMLARNSENKDANVPVFVQPNLEEWTTRLFNVRCSAMVLPKTLRDISSDLENWLRDVCKNLDSKQGTLHEYKPVKVYVTEPDPNKKPKTGRRKKKLKSQNDT